MCLSLCFVIVHGGLSQHCSNILLLCPAAVSTFCWASAKCLCGYSVQQEVTLTYTPITIFACHTCKMSVSMFNTKNIRYHNFVSCWKLLPLCIFFFFFFFSDLPCTMSLVEMKSLFRMDDIIASAPQPITTIEISARSGQGLQEVLSWLESIIVKWTIVCLFPITWCYSHRTWESHRQACCQEMSVSSVCKDC